MLYIKVVDGKTVDHPVYQENLMQVFGSVPEGYEPFNRTDPPSITLLEEFDPDAQQYDKIDGVWTDLWPVRPVSAEKREEIMGNIRQQLEVTRTGYLSYVDDLLALAKTDEQTQTLKSHAAQIAAVDFDLVDVLAYEFPMPPYAPVNGELLAVGLGDTEADGTSPEVIG